MTDDQHMDKGVNPMAVAFSSLIALGGLIPVVLVPRFTKMFADAGQELPLLTRILVDHTWVVSIVAMLILVGLAFVHRAVQTVAFGIYVGLIVIALFLPMILMMQGM